MQRTYLYHPKNKYLNRNQTIIYNSNSGTDSDFDVEHFSFLLVLLLFCTVTTIVLFLFELKIIPIIYACKYLLLL